MAGIEAVSGAPLDGFVVGYTIPQLGNAYVRRRQIMVLQQHFSLVSFERTKNHSWHIKVTAELMYSRTKSHLYFVIATCSS